MSTASKSWLTAEEYLVRERAAEIRSEYYRGEMFAMAGASDEHCGIKDNLAAETRAQLKGGPCRVRTSDLRVKVSTTGLYTYPDILIYCDNPQFEDAFVDTLLNPRVLVEVLSKSTESYDRGKKFAHYRQLPSLQEYILVAQDQPLVERFVRQPDGQWSLTLFEGLASVLLFTSVPVRIPLTEVYDGIAFPASPTSST
jgi:Uma2 family endonuclease